MDSGRFSARRAATWPPHDAVARRSRSPRHLKGARSNGCPKCSSGKRMVAGTVFGGWGSGTHRESSRPRRRWEMDAAARWDQARENGAYVLTIKGDVDLSNSRDLQRAIERMCARAREDAVV